MSIDRALAGAMRRCYPTSATMLISTHGRGAVEVAAVKLSISEEHL